MSRDDQVLSLLEGIDRKATERHDWYRQTIQEHEETVAKSLKDLAKEINKLEVLFAKETSETDKLMAVSDLKFKSFKAETRRETVITRWGVATGSLFIILIVSVLVSWYAKQPPQDINPLSISKDITRLR